MSPEVPAGIVAVDVCGTLVVDDTTLGLLMWHFQRRGETGKLLAIKALTNKRSPLRMAAMLAERLTGKHIAKNFAVGLLAGCPHDSLLASAQGYAQQLFESRRVRSVEQLLLEQESDHRLILCSASLEPVVRALADLLNADYVASELEVVDGKVTGRFSVDLTGRKVEALRAKFGIECAKHLAVCITDNLTDVPLLMMAEKRYVVLHKESHRPRWPVPGAVFIN